MATRETNDQFYLSAVFGIFVGAVSFIVGMGLVLTNYILFFLHWGEVTRVSDGSDGITVYGTRPYSGDFAMALWFWLTFAGFCITGAIYVIEESLKWLTRTEYAGFTTRQLGLDWRWVGVLMAAIALVVLVGDGCVRNEPYRKDFSADKNTRTFTIEAHLLRGLETRVIDFDEVARLEYYRGPRGENTPGSSDVSLVLGSGETIDLMGGWPRSAYEFAEAMVAATGWRSRCSGSGYGSGRCGWQQTSTTQPPPLPTSTRPSSVQPTPIQQAPMQPAE